MIRGRERRNSADLSDTLSLSGWIYADLLLGLMILFLASAVGVNPLTILSYAPEAKTATAEAIALAAIPTSTFTPTATPDWAATDAAINDFLATNVAATMAAIQTETGVPTSTPFPTPEPTDNFSETRTAIARQIVSALAATLTAAPTPTATPTLRPTRDAVATRTAMANRIATSIAATLTAEPTSTAGPTPTPRPTTNAEATQTAIAEVVLRAIEATLVAERPALQAAAEETAQAAQIATAFITTLTAEPSTATPVATLVAGLASEPVQVTISTNADALLNPTSAVGIAELERVGQEIRNEFARFNDSRQAGIVLTFGTSPDPSEGNELSRAVNNLLQQELPQLFNSAVLNDYHIISGNTAIRGDVEIEVYLVAQQ